MNVSSVFVRGLSGASWKKLWILLEAVCAALGVAWLLFGASWLWFPSSGMRIGFQRMMEDLKTRRVRGEGRGGGFLKTCSTPLPKSKGTVLADVYIDEFGNEKAKARDNDCYFVVPFKIHVTEADVARSGWNLA
eukprot:428781-Pyramimonas_sp.AAC.1